MASIARDSNGHKRVQFVAGDGCRKTIRLGKATVKQAEAIKAKIEQLALTATGITGVVDDATASWLTGLDANVYDKLEAAGLVGRRESTKSLGEFLEDYITGRHDIKSATVISLRQTAGTLIAFFGENKAIRDITPGEADQWRLYLVGRGLAAATVGRRSGIAKQFFKVALRRKLIATNPFEDLRAVVRGNKAKLYYITRTEAQKVLEACPDGQWRLLFALSRYGGLRCPSEHLLLRWVDVDWERSKMLVRSPKTEHHEGHDSRFVPLFPELLPYLREVFEAADEGTEYVITRYRNSNCNLRTHLQRIITKAGLKTWPKLFQNLRSTRETELCEHWPEHVVCAWIGNSKAVAREHYLQVTDEHFEQAAKTFTGDANVAQNAAQQMFAEPCITPLAVGETAKYDQKQSPAASCEALVGRVGIEPT